MEDADVGQAGSGALGGTYKQECRTAGQVQEFLYGVAAGATEDSVHDDAGDADRTGAFGLRELLEKLFFELMDGKLSTPEEMKAFLEPYSPPAPPPPVHLRRPRAAKKDAKPAKSRKKAAVAEGEAAAVEVAAEVAAAPVKTAGKVAATKVVPVAKTAPAEKTAAKKAVAPVKAAPVKVVAKKVAAKAPAKKAVAKSPAKRFRPKRR